jgi:hypothetical protein
MAIATTIEARVVDAAARRLSAAAATRCFAAADAV